MASRRSTAIQGALLRKGFRVGEKHHHLLVLYVDGQKTAIRTRLSHSRMDYGSALLARMKDQLQLPNVGELLRLIDCPMEHQQYVTLLRDRGKLPPSTH